MTYLKLDVGFPWHPRLAPLSDRAFRVHVIGLCHAKAYMTDGLIPDRLAVTWGARAAVLRELVDAGLWLPLEAGGYQLHDWLDYNPSAAELSAKRAEAGRRGGVASGKTRSKTGSKNEANDEAKRSTRAPAEQSSSRAEESRAVAEQSSDAAAAAEVVRAWERSTGTLITPAIADAMDAAVYDHGLETVLAAITETATANVRSWRYTAAILDRWKHEGRARASPPAAETVDGRRARYAAPTTTVLDADELEELRQRRLAR